MTNEAIEQIREQNELFDRATISMQLKNWGESMTLLSSIDDVKMVVDGRTLMDYVVVNGAPVPFVEELFNRGALVNGVVNREGETALFSAVRTGNKALTSLLISLGADVNFAIGAGYESSIEGKTAVIVACMFGEDEILEELLHHGASIEFKGDKGACALARANPARLTESSVSTLEGAEACCALLKRAGAIDKILEVV